MRALKVALIALGLLLATARVASAKAVGVIHCHTVFSDGIYTIEQVAQMAKDHGADFIVVTDHFEDIALTEEQFCDVSSDLVAGARWLNDAPKQNGIYNYMRACFEATQKVGILVVPGLEVGIGTNRDKVYDPAGGDNWDNKVHMLGVGCCTADVAYKLDAYLGHEDTKTYEQTEKTIRLDDAQDEVARLLHEAGLATVIAHPYLRDTIHRFHYTLYRNRMGNIDGIEFFNGSGPGDEKALEAMGLLDGSAGQFKPLAVTSGCDFHGHPGCNDPDLFYRQTAFPNITLPTYIANSADHHSACRLIAQALMRPSNIAALDNISVLDNPTVLTDNAAFYQDGKPISGDSVLGSAPVYLHQPGIAIARVTAVDSETSPAPSGQSGSSTEPDGIITIPPPGGELKITLISTEGLSRNRLGVILAGREVLICENVMNESRGKIWRIGPYKTGDLPKFFIDSSYSRKRCYPVITTGKEPSWTLSFEDWNDNDNDDVVIRVELVTGEQTSNTASQYKRIAISNSSSYDMRLHLAWHDESGWHNENTERIWEFKRGEKALLAQDNVVIRADRIKYWAESTNGQVGWRTDRKEEVKDISQDPGDTHTENFAD